MGKNRETQHSHQSGGTTSDHHLSSTATGDGLPPPPTSTASPTRHALYGFLRPAELHGRPCRLITGQKPLPYRPDQGGMPGAEIGLQAEDATIAELLKPLGYAPAIRQDHFGDKNKYLPTAARLRRVLRDLYHLNAEEEPENVDYPTDADFPISRSVRPRGVMRQLVDREGRPDRHPALGAASASRRSRSPGPSPRSA